MTAILWIVVFFSAIALGLAISTLVALWLLIGRVKVLEAALLDDLFSDDAYQRRSRPRQEIQ